MENYRIERDTQKCIGCGVCVTKCPTRAWTRSKKKYYKLSIMGRTGKKNPRLGQDFLVWADEENIIRIIKNTYKFVEEYISPDAPARKEHIGYIIDRVGFEKFKEYALKGVEFLPETIDRLMADAFVRPGDVIGVSRRLYEHYGIYVGAGRVIHYAGEGGDFGGRVSVDQIYMFIMENIRLQNIR